MRSTSSFNNNVEGEIGSGFELVDRGEHDEKLVEDLAVAERALDEYERRGIEGTISYKEYRADRLEPEIKRPPMTAGRAALLGLMRRYLTGLAEPYVTLLEVHKLLYFMQEAGEPLRLRYVKAPYGPYAENLRHVLQILEGHYITGGGAEGDRLDHLLHLIPGAIREAEAFLDLHPATRSRFDRVVELVAGFESPSGLELLATVHWVVAEIGSDTVRDVIRASYEWNERKKQFTERQIALALSTLRDRGWLGVAGDGRRRGEIESRGTPR